MEWESQFVYISINNNDGKLDQYEWASYSDEVGKVISSWANDVIETWYTLPNDNHQGACWYILIWRGSDTKNLKRELKRSAVFWHQESIQWAVDPESEYIRGDEIVEYGLRLDT